VWPGVLAHPGGRDQRVARVGAQRKPGVSLRMVRYRRNLVPGGTYFFTVTLADRRSSVLVEHIDALRAVVRETRAARPFAIDAVVVLPDHLHIVMTLPCLRMILSENPFTLFGIMRAMTRTIQAGSA
jgi:hypothetical protein